MLQLKYAAPQIGSMDTSTLLLHTKALLLRVHVITGWVVPQDALMLILVDQFSKKLSEDYASLNTEEIEYAFRKSGTTVKDWGKEMNLALLDEVLIPYLSRRRDISDMEEKTIVPPPQRIYTDEELRNLERKDIEECYQRLFSGYIPSQFPLSWIETLRGDGLAGHNETIDQFFQRKIEARALHLYQPVNAGTGNEGSV
ncbi:hypothetical protein JMG10_07710 [Nostoc ellipsosporum NOK]|nr:hypothetical protein [Nostoc ellipsosporum NOK]